jgi:GH24 family phage-related lysozyme (muramidase)
MCPPQHYSVKPSVPRYAGSTSVSEERVRFFASLKYEGAYEQFISVRVKTKAGEKKVVAPGLIKRRAQESAQFLNPATSASAANS